MSCSLRGSRTKPNTTHTLEMQPQTESPVSFISTTQHQDSPSLVMYYVDDDASPPPMNASINTRRAKAFNSTGCSSVTQTSYIVPYKHCKISLVNGVVLCRHPLGGKLPQDKQDQRRRQYLRQLHKWDYIYQRILMPGIINSCYSSALLPYSRTSLGLGGPKPPEIHPDQMQIVPPTISARNKKTSEIKKSKVCNFYTCGMLPK